MQSSDETPTQSPAEPAPQSWDEPPTQKWSDASPDNQSELPTQRWADASPESLAEPAAPQSWSDASTESLAEPATPQSWTDASTESPAEPAAPQSWSDASDDSEDEDSEDDELASSQPSRSGVFIHKGMLIAAAAVVVLAAVLVALLLFVNRPIDPPTDWIASSPPSSQGTVLYYLHWTNQNGALKGQLQLAVNSNGATQSVTAPTTGLYSRDNHIIFVVVTISGQAPVTLSGNINDNNDTLTLNQAGATDKTGQIVFHTGSANDYKQATNKLNTTKK